jgi:Fe-S cluster assembly protein SufB
MVDKNDIRSEKELSVEEAALKGLRASYEDTYGFHDEDVNYAFKSQKGLTREIVRQISEMKNEPGWMMEMRLKAYDIFKSKPMPTWGADLSAIDFDDIYYYVRATDQKGRTWEEVPDEIKRTFDRLGIPEAEQKYLQGVSAQYDSESVYHNIRKDLEAKGVIFLDMDSGLAQHPDLVREYFGTIIPSSDNKFAALNTAVWSGGSFIYVPPGVHVEMPLQAYFRINTQNMGQFERTLIIVDEGAYVHYVEGCLPAGELVSTGDKWVNIESVAPGDTVMDSDGNQAIVKSVRVRPFKGDMLTIRPISQANAFQVTPEHPVMAVKRRDIAVKRQSRNNWRIEVNTEKLIAALPQFVPAGELEIGDFMVFPISKVTSEHPRYTPEIMRLLGYYLAEGSAYIHNKLNQPVVSFTFNENEREYIDEVKTLIHAFTGKNAMEISQASRHGIEVRVYSRELMDLCVNECGKGAAEKRLSKTVMELPVDLQAHLLETYFNGDGSVYTKRKHLMLRASTASQQLAWQLQELLARQGHYATIAIRKGGKDVIQGREITRRDQYILYYSPDNQQSEVRLANGYFLVPIKEISRTPYDGPVFNFELTTAPNAYVTRGFAVHNCTAPIYSSDSLHSAVVEIIIKENGRCRYTTIQNWSNNVYNLVTKRAVAHKNAAMEWVDGNLGCLAEGSTVTTPDGIKTIESLEAGDRVLSYDEHSGELCFRTVVAKRFSGYQPVHTVSVGERKLKVTANHPFYSYIYDGQKPKKLGRYRLAYVRADHLKKAIIPRRSINYGKPHRLEVPCLVTEFESLNQYSDNLTMTRSRQSRMKVDEYTTDDIMWLFGYWVGDGNIEIAEAKTEGVVRFAKVGFSTPREDRARERLVSTMTALIDAEPTERPDGHHLAWNSKELAEFFQANGFEGKAQTKRVPAWVWSLPESQRLTFIAGYIDADGTVTEGRFGLKSANRGLLEDIASLLVTLGITSRLYTEFDEPRQVTILGIPAIAHGAYRLAFALDERLLRHVSPALQAKALRQNRRMKIQRHTVGRSNIELSDDVEIVSVEVSEPTTEDVPTWDIEVEGTGNFVSQGFIVHNSKITMKYPAVVLAGEGAHGEVLSIAFAGKGQHQDAGGKITHLAPNTSSQIISKSISKDGGRASYRGLLKIVKGADNVKSNVVCDALLLDAESRSDTYPYIECDAQNVTMGHEASVSKIGEDQLFYLMSRGLSEDEANAMIVNGFIEPLVKELPMEYALELNRLIQIQLEGSIG